MGIAGTFTEDDLDQLVMMRFKFGVHNMTLTELTKLDARNKNSNCVAVAQARTKYL